MQIDYPSRIVCLTEETTETLYLMGESERIVGISGFTVRPPEARKEKPKVSAFTSAKIDKILDLKPDLVLGFSDMQADIAAALVKAGVQVHIFNQRTITGILQMIQTLGGLIGEPQKAAVLIGELVDKIETVKNLTNTKKTKPKVYFEEWYDPYIVGITWVSQLIQLAGGEDVFADIAKNGQGKDRILADGQPVIESNPDIIIGSWCGRHFRPEIVKKRPGWQTINAVKNERLYEIKSPLILQPGPACLTDGLDEMIKIIGS
ncbi:cobalamin-binding protein [Aliikangiella coralliicola]|uniref:Cobalamin-binding protein n=1 Tax=Aliikangiella coralliicola TaxID=2592383 RepID=A0A545UDS3_9GAMM|nr:cobalamin-binding protein [Aliikangiella coralliicola]TQV87617.1 cobalamin-binding protein [Aliikangiella coralliicola]